MNHQSEITIMATTYRAMYPEPDTCARPQGHTYRASKICVTREDAFEDKEPFEGTWIGWRPKSCGLALSHCVGVRGNPRDGLKG